MGAQGKLGDLIDQAVSAARKSRMLHQHGAVAIHDKFGLIASGHNRVEKYLCHSFSVHAEADVLNKVKKVFRQGEYSSVTLVVVRLSKEKLKLSKPCQSCQSLIQDMGVKKVYYSVNE